MICTSIFSSVVILRWDADHKHSSYAKISANGRNQIYNLLTWMAKTPSPFSGWYMFQRTVERSRQHGCERDFIFYRPQQILFHKSKTTWCFGFCLADDIAMFRVFRKSTIGIPEIYIQPRWFDRIQRCFFTDNGVESGESSCFFVKWWGGSGVQVIDNHSRMRGQCVIGTQSLWGAMVT